MGLLIFVKNVFWMSFDPAFYRCNLWACEFTIVCFDCPRIERQYST